MAKGKAAAPAADDQETFSFDTAAMEAELAKVREKYLKGAREQLETLTAQRAEIEVKIDTIEAVIAKAEGRDISKVIRKAEGGTRMKRDEKAAYEAKAIAFLSGQKEGASRAEVASGIGLEPSQAAGILKALKEAGKAKTEGEKAATKWFAK